MGDMLVLIFYPSKIKFGAFRLKLANELQESPDCYRLQLT